jgi:NAD(P)-dependent dehydrogenase (short-subunit alcohol dehydrogenase family)
VGGEGSTMLLQNTVALVTGSSRGIGAAIARGFARQGATVIVNYFRSSEAAKEVLATVRKSSPESLALEMDVSDQTAVNAAVRRIIDRFGRIDVLVNNAGVLEGGSVLGLGAADIDRIMRVNLHGAVHCIQAVTGSMKDRKNGSLIKIGSISQFSPFYDSVAYAMSKGALRMLTRCSALELAPFDIRVNTVVPGIIRSDIDPKYQDEKLMVRMRKAVPLKRIGTPEDVVGAVVFLASRLSVYVTGIDILVDGGFMLFKEKNPTEEQGGTL